METIEKISMAKMAAVVFLVMLGTVSLSAKTSFLSNQGVSLAWFPGTNPNIAGYKVHYGTASHQYNHVVDAGGNSEAEVTNLVAGTTYYFAVTAYTDYGFESEPSEEISYEVPMPPSGQFNGLFYSDSGVQLNSAGYFTMQVTAQGAYTGKLQLKGKSYSFRGQLNAQLQVTNQIARAGDSALTLIMDVQSEQISGQLTDGSGWVAGLQADRAVYNTRTNPAPFAGTYTLILPGQQSNSLMPMGSGYGSVKVDGNGAVRFTGVLPDGTKITQSTTLSRNRQWPFYVSLYSGKGVVMSWLNITNQSSSDLNGAVNWIKSSGVTGRYYPAGFTDEISATGATYVAPKGPNGVLTLTRGHVTCIGGDFPSGFSNGVMMAANKASGPNATISFSASTGIFSGRMTDSATGKTYSFGGAVLQKLNTGYGFLLGTDQSSEILLTQ